jgi:hypothetical protein
MINNNINNSTLLMAGILAIVVMLSTGLAIVLTTIQKAEVPSCSGGSSCFNFRTESSE